MVDLVDKSRFLLTPYAAHSGPMGCPHTDWYPDRKVDAHSVVDEGDRLVYRALGSGYVSSCTARHQIWRLSNAKDQIKLQ